MKKFLATVLSATLAFSLIACGGGNGNSGNANNGNGGNNDPDATDSGYGTLDVCDTYAWLGDYPETEFVLNFSNPSKAETVTYEYDDTYVQIDESNHTVKALREGTAEIKVSSEHFETTFNVYCETVDTDPPDKAFSLTEHANGSSKGWDTRVRGFEDEWQLYGHNNITTLFIGDSFFDVGFWNSFYSDYAGKDARCWGIGSTTTYSWETIVDRLLVNTAPKNVVMHCGTNNVYDLKRSADDITSSLERLFTLMHDRMPGAKLYWFNIPRRYPGDASLESVSENVNGRFAAWAAGRDWLTVIDTRSKYTVDKTLSTDGLHPNADGYALFIEELAKTDIKIINS